MNIAIQGCLHGQLDEVYKQLSELQSRLNIKIDLLIICGDFQALRDQTDLDYLHCPQKYKSMGSFYKYFEQQKAPILTIFIGGNHQAVNYMRDLYFGGWVADNIYYLGQAGSIYINKGTTRIRITGMSGIYNHRDFQYVLKPQRTPLYGGSRISAYHIKQLEVYRLELLSRITQMKRQESGTYGKEDDVMGLFLTHDWPKNIALFGKTSELYRYKPFLEKEINSGVFGSPPGERLMKLAKPKYWFSAHMHVKYPALYPHGENEFTHFLALDKCLQKRSCLQLLHFKSSTNSPLPQPLIPTNTQQQNDNCVQITLDKSWLTVLNLTQGLQCRGQVLYLFEEKSQEYKLCNSKMMNEMIMKFPQVYKQLFGEIEIMGQNQNYCGGMVKVPLFDQQREFAQTEEILRLCKIKDPRIFQGIIFPKGYFANPKVTHSHQQDNNTDNVQQIQTNQKTPTINSNQNPVSNVDDEIELEL